jgi:hypothetical protein
MELKAVAVIYCPFAQETSMREYQIQLASTGNPLLDCQTVFNLLNDDNSPLAAELDRARKRSMMPGDGVIIDGKIYRCGLLGWKEVSSRSELGSKDLFG